MPAQSQRQHQTCRGVCYLAPDSVEQADTQITLDNTSAAPAASASGPAESLAPISCDAQLFMPTSDARLIAVDPATGARCANFADSWSVASADEELGLIYLPMGNRTPDQLGMYRTPAEEKYTSSVVALSLETGEPLLPIREEPAPQGTIDGDWTSPTQPSSALSFTPVPLRAADRWGASLLDQMMCRIQFQSLHY